MKKLIFISIFFLGLMSYSQDTIVWLGNTDRQKIDSISYSNDTLRIKIENDELKKVRIVGGGNGDFMADGSVPATGDFDMDANSILDINELSFRKQDSGTDVGSIFMPDANRWYFTKSASSIGAILNLGSIASSSKTFTFPNTSGTVALTSDLSSYVALTGTQSIDGLKTFIGDYLTIDNTLLGSPTDDSYIRFKNSTLAGLGISAGYGALYFLDDKVRFAVSDGASGNTNNFGIDPSALTASQDLIVTDTDMTWNGTSLLSGGSADNLGNHTATEDLDMGGFALNNATALTATSRVNTEEVRFNPDNTIGSSTDNNTFGFKTGDIMYVQRVNQTIELGLDFNALTADKNLVFTDSDITWGGTSLLGSGGGLSSTDIDTFEELDAIVSNASLMKLGGSGGSIPTSLDYARFTSGNTVEGLSSSELLADIVSQGAVNTSSAQTLTNKTINADNNTISNIGSAEITDGSITSIDIATSGIFNWSGLHSFLLARPNYYLGARYGFDLAFYDYTLSRDGDNLSFKAETTVSSGAFTEVATLNSSGDFEAASISITGGTSDDILLGDGTTTSLAGIGSSSFEVADIGATDKTLTSSDVHKFNYTDDSVTFTLDNSLSVGDELTFAVTDIDSIITVVPDTGVDIIGNGTEPIDGGFQIDSLNVGKVKKLASNLYYAMGYIKPYSPSVSLIVPSLDNANTVAYIDAREFAASSNGASVSPTDQTSNGTTFTSTDITKQTDADSDPTFSFNGTSSRISLGNNFNFTAGVAQSIGIFISADGFGTGTRFAKRDDATGGSNDHFAIYNGYYYMGNNEGNPSFSSTTNVLITLTKTTGDVWYIYENGTQRATGAWTNETSAADLLIGAQVNGGGFSDYSTGEIEVFFISDDFITNTEAGTIATEINTR